MQVSTLPAGTPEKGDKEQNETEVRSFQNMSLKGKRAGCLLCVTPWVCRELPGAGYEAGLCEQGGAGGHRAGRSRGRKPCTDLRASTQVTREERAGCVQGRGQELGGRDASVR